MEYIKKTHPNGLMWIESSNKKIDGLLGKKFEKNVII